MERFDPQKFAEEYAERLRSSDEYRPKLLYLPSSDPARMNMADKFEDIVSNPDKRSPRRLGYTGEDKDFIRQYKEEYFPKVQRLARDAKLPTIGEEIDEFVAKTGLEDPRLDPDYTFDLRQAQHEIHSHLRPYKAGFAPDYRNLPAANPGTPKFSSNPVSPINERFARILDDYITDYYIRDKRNSSLLDKDYGKITAGNVKQMFRYNADERELSRYLKEQGEAAGLSSSEVEANVRDFMTQNYPDEKLRHEPISTALSDPVANEIADQLNKKYLPQAQQDYKNKVDLFYPQHSIDAGERSFRFQDLFRYSDDPDIKNTAIRFTQPGTNYIMSLVPGVSPDVVDAKAIGNAAKLSAVDLIPSREAVRDFAKGDVKQGATRMAQEYVQGIPVALGAGTALSSLPMQAAAVANPLAAGVAGGVALTRAGEALDEATKQQTGEGLLDKFQQTVGKLAGPGFGRQSTGAAYRGSERADEKLERLRREAFNPSAPSVAQLGQGTRATQPVPQNELQRRFRMAQQRFNPARGEFGFTELLGGK
tara:strand:+ start:88 stop:1695 length:1608 start_codon:yes stop_codon:yes gene_type:complete